MKLKHKIVHLFLAMMMTLSLIPSFSSPVIAAANENLALGQTATASSSYPNRSWTPDKAVDGDVSGSDSRWSSKRATGTSNEGTGDTGTKEQWLAVDLGEETPINQIEIYWEAAFATEYDIQVSLNGEDYETVKTCTAEEAGQQTHRDLGVDSARFVRIYCREPKTASYGYSIYELEVYAENRMESAKDVLDSLQGQAPRLSADQKSVILPEVPEGYRISLFGSDNQQVLKLDGTIIQPLVDMNVNLLYKVVNESDETDYATSDTDIQITIPGKYMVQAGDNAVPNVLPGLREWKGSTGNFVISDDTDLILSDDSMQQAAEVIQTYFMDMLDREINIVSGEEPQSGDIYLRAGGSVEELGEEGYELIISDTLTITSPTVTGMTYGGATITQILYQDEDRNEIPKGLVRDYPKYEVRAGMIDVGRMYIPLEYLEEMSIYMSWFKLNETHVHINDYWSGSGYSAFRLESEVYPMIVAEDGYYTKDDYRQYQKDMKKYGIDVITEIDTPYHAECFRDIPGVKMLSTGYLDITTDEARAANQEIIENLIDEYLDGEDPVIQSDHFHIGTDEYSKSYGEQMRAWTDHFINYVNDKGYESRVWASLGKNGFNGTTPVSTDATLNLWAPYWADVHEMYDLGYDIINTYGGWLYIVPSGNAGYPDRMDLERLYNEFEVNNFKSGRNPSGEAIMPIAHPQTKGAEFCLWNDMTSFRTGFSWFDVFDRFKDGVAIVSEKTWFGEKQEGQTYEQFQARMDAVIDKVPNANPGRFAESDTDVIADYEFEDAGTTAIDSSTNGYDAELVNAEVNDGAVTFDGTGYMSMPVDSVGYPYTVLMNVTFDEITDDATLFSGADGTFYLNKLGQLSYARGQYEFTFNYTPKAGEKLAIALTCDSKNLTLYVNGRLIGTGKLTNETIGGKSQQSSTFVLPVEKIFDHVKGTLDDLTIYNRVLSDEEIYEELGIERENLALNKDVDVSGLEVSDGRFTADKAVDGIVSSDSRVSFSRAADEQWLLVDLGDVYEISEFVINYESVVGKYEIQVSEDGEEFTTVYTKNEATVEGSAGVQSIETIEIEPVDARYVKYVQKERWHHTGNGNWYSGSIYEFEVYAPISTTVKPSRDALVALDPSSSGAISAKRAIGPSTSNQVSVEFDMYTSLDPAETNTAVGLGSTDSNYTAYGQVPIIVRMYQGTLGAYNGAAGGYVQSDVRFTQNEAYHIRIEVDLSEGTYTAYATGPDGEEKVFAENYTYRAAAPSEIGKIYLFNNERPAGSYWLEDITLSDVEETVDKTALSEAIDAAKAIEEEGYTADSWTALQDALAAAETIMADEDATQEQVDQAASALQSAMDALQVKASASALNALQNMVDKAETLGSDDEALNAAITAAKALLADPDNASVTAVVSALLDLSEAMQALNTDESTDALRADVQATIDFIKEHILTNVDNVRPGKVQALKDAVAAAEELLASEDATADELKAANKAMTKAAQELWEIVSKAELNALIEAANGYLDGDYTTESLEALQAAITAAQTVAANEDATTAEVTEAITNLSDAISNLEAITLDTSALEHEIELVTEMIANLDNYVPSSVEGLQEKLDAAKTALSNATTQAEIDEATKTLREARLNARTKADTSALEEIIAYANSLDLAGYAAESRNMLDRTIVAVKRVLADPEATQEKVDQAVQTMQTAIDSLQVVENSAGSTTADTTNTAAAAQTAAFAGMLAVSAAAILMMNKRRRQAK